MSAQEPDSEDGNQGAGKQVGGDHGEPDSEREGEEHGLAGSGHEKCGNEHGEDTEHGEQPGDGSLGGAVERSECDRLAGGEMGMDVLYGDGGFVHENTDSERKAAQSH